MMKNDVIHEYSGYNTVSIKIKLVTFALQFEKMSMEDTFGITGFLNFSHHPVI
jgi:hypothetical protein